MNNISVIKSISAPIMSPPPYNISFRGQDGVSLGVLTFNKDGLSFDGKADESAMIFVKCIGNAMSQKVSEYEMVLNQYRHIPLEGGQCPADEVLTKWSVK